MDEERRAGPRRLLSFDATQLSRIGKVFYSGSSPRQIQNTARKQDAAHALNCTTVLDTKAPITHMAPHSELPLAALLSKDTIELVKMDEGATSLHSLKTSGGQRFMASAASWQGKRRAAQPDPGAHAVPSSPRNTNQQKLAVADSSGTVRLYELGPSRLALTATSASVGRAIRSISFNTEQPNLLIAGVSDGSCRGWDLRQGFKRPVLAFSRSGDVAREVQFQPGSEFRFGCIYDSGVVQRWDIRQRQSPDYRINAHQQGLSLDWHPSMNYLATGGRDHLVQIWNMNTEWTASAADLLGGGSSPDYVLRLPTSVSQLSWAANPGDGAVTNSNIVTAGRPTESSSLRGTYSVWSLNRPHVPLHTVETHTEAVTSVFALGSKVVWSTGADGKFVQTDLRFEPKVTDTFPPAVVAMAPWDMAAVSFPCTQSPTKPISSNATSASSAAGGGGSALAHQQQQPQPPTAPPYVRRGSQQIFMPSMKASHLTHTASAIQLGQMAQDPSTAGLRRPPLRGDSMYRNYSTTALRTLSAIGSNVTSPPSAKFPPNGGSPGSSNAGNSHVAGLLGPGGFGIGGGSVPGSIPGSVGSSAPGSVPGSVPGSIPGSVPGSMPGSVPGSMPGSVPGSMPDAGFVYGADSSTSGSIPKYEMQQYMGSTSPLRGLGGLNAVASNSSIAAAGAAGVGNPSTPPSMVPFSPGTPGYFGDMSNKDPADLKYIIEIGLPFEDGQSLLYTASSLVMVKEFGQTYGQACRWNSNVMNKGSRYRYAELWTQLGVAIDSLESRFLKQLSVAGTKSEREERELAEAWFGGLVDDRFEVRAVAIDDRKTRDDAVAANEYGLLFEDEADLDQDNDGDSLPDSDWPASPLHSHATPRSLGSFGRRASMPRTVQHHHHRRTRSRLSRGSSHHSSEGRHHSLTRSTHEHGDAHHHRHHNIPHAPEGHSGLNNDGAGVDSKALLMRPEFTEKDPFEILKDKYWAFAEAQKNPWDFLPMLKDSIHTSLRAGYYTSAIALLMMFRAFPGLSQEFNVTEILQAGLLHLSQYGAFGPAALIKKLLKSEVDNGATYFDYDAAVGNVHTSGTAGVRQTGSGDLDMPDIVCHRCLRSLSDNAAFYARNDAVVGYWYCSKCNLQLDGCSLCDKPIRGLSKAIINCGHRIHIECWNQWVCEDGMKECPAGCGELITSTT